MSLSALRRPPLLHGSPLSQPGCILSLHPLNTWPRFRPASWGPRRHFSLSSRRSKDPDAAPELPKMTFTRFLRTALTASFRNLALSISPSGIRSAYHQSPALTTLNLALLIFTLGFAFVAIRAFIKTFYNPQISKYPDPVANSLRRALYYSNVSPDPELALKFYQKAMAQCNDLGLDPFSDEVLGIRIQVSQWLQKLNLFKPSIQVLEAVLADCKRWVAVMEQSSSAANETKGEDKEKKPEAEDSSQPAETLWRKRERLLAKAVGTSVKLGELYADEHVLDPKKSHAHLLWAVETSLAEFKRRQSDGARPGEESWLTPEQLGGSIESLGRDYERSSQFQLAIPLFFQALRLCDSPCHRAVIMNNLSASFAQQPIFGPSVSAAGDGDLDQLLGSSMPTTRKDCLDAAANWAQNAYQHALDVKEADRTPECDEACAVALCNWGDVAAMMGKTDLARSKYEQCLAMSRSMGFQQGLDQAQSALNRLAARPQAPS